MRLSDCWRVATGGNDYHKCRGMRGLFAGKEQMKTSKQELEDLPRVDVYAVGCKLAYKAPCACMLSSTIG
jgi:hypothetical protein